MRCLFRSIALLATICAAFLNGNFATRAATIEKSEKKDCAFELRGTIERGDFDRLSATLAANKIDPLDERTGAVCLRSSGGSYFEGLRIAQLIFVRGMSTVIQSGAECFSACALIFLGGTVSDQLSPNRKLSFNGLVGFHAPYRKRGEQKNTEEEISSATDDMRQAILALMQFAAQRSKLTGDNIAKPTLLAKLVSKGPQEAVFIQTIYDAARWDILLYDIESYLPTPRPSEGIKNLCANFHAANMDQERSLVEALSIEVENYSSRYQKNDYRVLVRNSQTKDTVCEIYPRTAKGNEKVMFFGCSFDYWSNKNFGDCRQYLTAPSFRVGKYIPAFFSFDPHTSLLRFSNQSSR